MLDPCGQHPWVAVRRAQCSILCSRSRIRGREPSRFLGGKQLEKPETDSIIAEQLSGWKAFTASTPKVFCLVPRNPKRAPATSGFATART